jgi:hypothetical protein
LTYLLLGGSVNADDGLTLAPGIEISFLTREAGADFLAKPDDFVKTLSPFDRASRMQVGRVVRQAEFLKHVRAQVLDWDKAETGKVNALLKKLWPRMANLKLPWPKTIHLIKTTGKEEGNAAYTRRSALILPADKLKQKDQKLERLLAHELFHVLSRSNPKLSTRLYRIIGYEPVPPLIFPAELLLRKLTNPDAPYSRHAIEVERDGRKVKVAPILYARTEKYDEKQGGAFFRYLVFRLLVLDVEDLSKAMRDADGKLALLKPEEAKGFKEKIGRNTGYIIHPEETMADNFVYLVLGKKDLPNPEIVQAMKKIFTGNRR